ncbi:MAG TPA: hypothetical protein VIL35_11405 [Vicinamibacterales bacterium]
MRVRSRRRLAHAVSLSIFVAGCAFGIAACEDSPTGPSLSAVTVQNLSLRPTTGNPGLCCCHVVGTARNDNTVPVHVTIKFAAFNQPNADPLSTILYFIKDLQPGQTHAIDAPGFIFPCNAIPEGIRNVRTEIDVKGITFPPG